MTITRTTTCDGCGASPEPKTLIGWRHHTPPGWACVEILPWEGIKPADQHFCPSCWSAMGE